MSVFYKIADILCGMKTYDIDQSKEIYSVSALNRDVRYLLENNFANVWVEGEISNFSVPQSGHWYFSLKDTNAQVRCAMFKPQNRRLNFCIKDGMRVFMKARVSLYEGRGDFQLLVEFLEEAGVGKLRQAFEVLKKRLAERGLFDTIHKKTLPSLPETIGIITSATGAALKDILSVLKRRYSLANVIIYPTQVQGDLAPDAIARALELANHRKECDVIILARGGGSLEDLWSFNEEKVAHAIFQSDIPIISGIGHEIDFTIADFVADVRAPTPSAAAELIAPDAQELLNFLNASKLALTRQIKGQLASRLQQITWIEKALSHQHPKRKLLEHAQKLDFFEITLLKIQQKFLHQHQATLQALAGKLDALSPLATLKRGFAIVTREKDHCLVRSKNDVKKDDLLDIQLTAGNIRCRVE